MRGINYEHRDRRKDQEHAGRGDDIGLDSIDSIEIIAGIDNLFGVQMTGAARENFQTIETLTKYVEEHMGE